MEASLFGTTDGRALDVFRGADPFGRVDDDDGARVTQTIEQAAAPPESLQFMFWGAGLFVTPLTLIYTASVYRVFRGKVVDAQTY